MEVKDLLKLIPEEDRPKGRKLIHAGFLLDTSGMIMTVNESTAFEKDFPNFELIVYALTMYWSHSNPLRYGPHQNRHRNLHSH
jgi:hypothetical protein